MDWVGVCLLGSVTALGGGSMRDILLGRYPLSWVAHPYYLLVTAGAALFTIAIAPVVHRLRNVFLVLDAIGLALFTVIGCNVALDLQLPFLIVIMSGMITGCVGGVLRDVLCNDIPLLFRSELYASVSVVAGALYVGGLAAGLPHDFGDDRLHGRGIGAPPACHPLRLEHAEIRLHARSALARDASLQGAIGREATSHGERRTPCGSLIAYAGSKSSGSQLRVWRISADRNLDQRWALALERPIDRRGDRVAIVRPLRRHAHRAASA